MTVQLRISLAGAIKMGLPVQDEPNVLEATMSVVELAGRLTLATGRAITPHAVEAYLAGVRRARLALECITRNHDRASLALHFAVASCRRRIWAPTDVGEVITWLSCVLIARYLASPRHAGSDEQDLDWAKSVNVTDLVDICETHFASAYALWVERPPVMPSEGE